MIADWVSVWGVTPRPLDYATFVGMYLLRQRGWIRKAYATTLGMGEYTNRADMSDEWVEALTDDPHEAAKFRYQVNSQRFSLRTWSK